MKVYEYKVVPAPTKGTKAKGVKGPEARFSLSIETLLNEVAAEGWEYQRAETLPSIERAGLTSTTTEWRNVLIFRRPLEDEQSAAAETPDLLPAPEAVAPIAAAALGGVTRVQEAPPEAATPVVLPDVAVEEASENADDPDASEERSDAEMASEERLGESNQDLHDNQENPEKSDHKT